jgi:hypothetical protein
MISNEQDRKQQFPELFSNISEYWEQLSFDEKKIVLAHLLSDQSLNQEEKFSFESLLIIGGHLTQEELEERQRSFYLLEPNLHDSLDCELAWVIVDLRADMTKEQPTKLELMIEIIRKKRNEFGSSISFELDDFVHLFTDTFDARQSASHWIGKLNRKLKAFGWKFGPLPGYHFQKIQPTK